MTTIFTQNSLELKYIGLEPKDSCVYGLVLFPLIAEYKPDRENMQNLTWDFKKLLNNSSASCEKAGLE